MNKDNDRDLKELFENDGVILPESLSKENMTRKIKEKDIEQKKKKIKVFPKIVSAAAAAAIVITCVALFPGRTRFSTSPAETQQTAQSEAAMDSKNEKLPKATGLSKFDSDEDLKAYFNSIYQKRKDMNGLSLLKGKASYDSAAPAAGNEGATVAVTTAAAAEKSTDAIETEEFSSAADNAVSNSSANYGKTNTQVRDVDEADIIKNDGRYIYAVNSTCFSIIDTQTMERVYQSELKPDDEKHGYSFSDMYVSENRLVVTGSEYEIYSSDGGPAVKKKYSGNNYYYYDGLYPYNKNLNTVSFVFDITDRSNPVLTRALTQDGSVMSSRMVGSVLYTVTRYTVNASDKKDVETKYAPSVNGDVMLCDEIFVKDTADESTSYIVLTAYDTADADGKVGKVSMLGNCDEIYCSADTLYLTNCVYKWDDKYENGKNRTELYAFSLNGTDVAYKANGIVPGIIDNQYSMDQYGSYFRLTTTDYDYSKDVDISSLYVLDSNLKTVGKLKNFADDEQVKSTRFMGKTAYVVTFRNTDPLFVIDLSNPQQPVITGSVKLPGFSEYLHPVSDSLLVGIGYNGDDERADFSCIKVSLFDVSNPASPKELDSHIIKEASTDVTFDAKAFIFDSERSIIGFPVNYENYSSKGEYKGFNKVFKMIAIKDNKFTDEKGFVHESYTYNENSKYYYPQFFRGTYIGDNVYTLTDTTIKEFSLENTELLRSLKYYEPEEIEDDDYIVYNGLVETAVFVD